MRPDRGASSYNREAVAALEFSGTEEYRVVRKLGEGGLGVVYEADSAARGERVALKTFKRASSDAVFRLKREFLQAPQSNQCFA